MNVPQQQILVTISVQGIISAVSHSPCWRRRQRKWTTPFCWFCDCWLTSTKTFYSEQHQMHSQSKYIQTHHRDHHGGVQCTISRTTTSEHKISTQHRHNTVASWQMNSVAHSVFCLLGDKYSRYSTRHIQVTYKMHIACTAQYITRKGSLQMLHWSFTS